MGGKRGGRRGGWGVYLLIFISKVFGMIGHSEHFGENLGCKYGAFRIADFNFLF